MFPVSFLLPLKTLPVSDVRLKTSSYSVNLSLIQAFHVYIAESKSLLSYRTNMSGRKTTRGSLSSCRLPGRNFMRRVACLSSTLWLLCPAVSGLVTYCMMSVLLSWSKVIQTCWWSTPADFIYLIFFFGPPSPPTATPKHSGIFSTSMVVSSSSGYSSPHSPSRPCQDDCMRPVRRLPVSDLPLVGGEEWEGVESKGNAVKKLSC